MIFLSQSSISKRGYVQLEFQLALDALKEMPAGTIHTIPVRLDDFEIPDELPDALKDLLSALPAGAWYTATSGRS